MIDRSLTRIALTGLAAASVLAVGGALTGAAPRTASAAVSSLSATGSEPRSGMAGASGLDDTGWD
ncbi:hypothetical protein [Streptomyces sp. WMMB303]|uniref:hypothetical protein n=1 Tax=Streptomyces sp. WMMB303 TaxID=3034154 RepID=UPI0023EB00AE|nr:hypothetical protein [Streptomyces sp. WMMB303]MDF4251749.1 hypothetical protein [Streptomyces sp. WMMB303]